MATDKCCYHWGYAIGCWKHSGSKKILGCKKSPNLNIWNSTCHSGFQAGALCWPKLVCRWLRAETLACIDAPCAPLRPEAMRSCAVTDMETHIASLETARAALEAPSCCLTWLLLVFDFAFLVCLYQAKLAGCEEGQGLLEGAQAVVAAVAAYKHASASVRSLVPKPKAKAKAKSAPDPSKLGVGLWILMRPSNALIKWSYTCWLQNPVLRLCVPCCRSWTWEGAKGENIEIIYWICTAWLWFCFIYIAPWLLN